MTAGLIKMWLHRFPREHVSWCQVLYVCKTRFQLRAVWLTKWSRSFLGRIPEWVAVLLPIIAVTLTRKEVRGLLVTVIPRSGSFKSNILYKVLIYFSWGQKTIWYKSPRFSFRSGHFLRIYFFESKASKSSGEGHRNPLQYSCLENSMDRGAWRPIAHGVAESDLTEVT